MSVGKSSIKRALGAKEAPKTAVEEVKATAPAAAPAEKKPAAKKAPAKKPATKKSAAKAPVAKKPVAPKAAPVKIAPKTEFSLGDDLPYYLL